MVVGGWFNIALTFKGFMCDAQCAMDLLAVMVCFKIHRDAMGHRHFVTKGRSLEDFDGCTIKVITEL